MPYGVNLSFWTVIELALACVLLLLAIDRPDLGRKAWTHVQIAARRLERRPLIMIALAGAAPVVLRLALLPLVPVPEPYVMEEFNHLFLIDTYLLGRIANPVHPLAVMIQSYQQIEWPSLVSARPPLPPIFLYLGKLVFGSPFAGNLMALGATMAAICWALQAWVGERMAAITTLLAVMTFGVFGYWVNSYWGATTIVLGGALLFGAVPRLEQRPTLAMALVCIVGTALLAGTRPFENGVFALIVFGWLAWRYLQTDLRPLIGRAVLVFVLPLAIGTLGILALQLSYNAGTTGNPLLMPYQIWRASQDVTPNFLWQPNGPEPTFYHLGAAYFSAWNLAVADLVRDGGITGAAYLFSRHAVTFRDLLGPFLFIAFACWSPRKINTVSPTLGSQFFVYGLWLVLTLLAVSGPMAGSAIKLLVLYILFKRWANPVERLPVLVILGGMIATSLSSFYMNIYFAAYTVPLLVLVANGLGTLARWHGRIGRSIAGYILIGASLVPLGQAVDAALNLVGAGWPRNGPALSHFDKHYPSPRAEVIATVGNLPGRHVIFVEVNGPLPDSVDPVWNAPDVDAQKVVWLRRLRPDWTATAQTYYAGRSFWLMDMDQEGKYTLARFPIGNTAQAIPLVDLPNPDRVPAEKLGARATAP